MGDPDGPNLFLWLLLGVAAKAAEKIKFFMENQNKVARFLAQPSSVQFPAATQPPGGLRMKLPLPSVITPIMLRPMLMLMPTPTPTYQETNTVGLLMMRVIVYHLLSRQLAVGGESERSSVVEGPEMGLEDVNKQDIDEDLHSRQLAVGGELKNIASSSSRCSVVEGSEMGLEGVNMQDIDEDGREKMRRAPNVLISGLQGLGAEIAKNLLLAGYSVTLHDEGSVELWDLSSNFVFSEEDVGKNRALASVQKLQELNNTVLVSTLSKKLTKEQLSNFQAVVFTDIDLETAIEFDDYCHSHQPPIPFIKSEVRGFFGSIFSDFGPEFIVVDVGCKEPHTGFEIASISNSNPALVTCDFNARPELKDGDLVTFSKIPGMAELNDGKPRKIKSCTPFSFYLLEDTTNFGTYAKGGIVTQVKQPKVLNFKPLREALKTPGEFLPCDFSKRDRRHLLHLAFQALDKFICDLGRFPVSGSEDDAQKLISIATTMNESLGDGKLDDLNPKLLQDFAYGARAVLNPMAALFGGIVGQEVVKACSGKFGPLHQFFYFDSVESLPTKPLEPSEYKPWNSRYDAQISVFGAKFQEKLENTKSFVVGSGALGCEFLKNLALMGVSCGTEGKLTVTDDAVIEESNLSGQFLFRDWNIGQAKSTVAASAAALINPNLQIEALQSRVGLETENLFDDTFWENFDVVINALENSVDQRCLYFQKPLLQPGTPGAKCNTKMVILDLIKNYRFSRDPPEKQAPMCTMLLPLNIDHCLTWARSEFEGLLEKTPTDVNAYLSEEYTGKSRESLERVLECVDLGKCETFQDCITWARLKFEDYFSNSIKQLICTFPEDAVISTGALFWSAPKRFPRPLEFSVFEPDHLKLVLVGSILRAETFHIPIPDWAKNLEKLAEEVVRVNVPDFQPKQGVRFETDENATSLSSASIDDGAVIEELIKKIERCIKRLPSDYSMKPIQFGKDDGTDYHMDFIAGLANMRAKNYSIPEVNKLSAKLIIAGRNIPAIISGLVCLELYKVIDGGH